MKQIVLYNRSLGYANIKVGLHAIVYPVNHPSGLVTNGKDARTSEVIRVDNAVFETKNTIYVPLRMDTVSSLHNIMKESEDES